MHDWLIDWLIGLDGIPVWFLWLGTPIFTALIAQLFNQATAAGTVPTAKTVEGSHHHTSDKSQQTTTTEWFQTNFYHSSTSTVILKIHCQIQHSRSFPLGFTSLTSLPSDHLTWPQQQLSLSSIPHSQCCHPMPLYVSLPWIFPRLLAPYDMAHWGIDGTVEATGPDLQLDQRLSMIVHTAQHM